VLVLAATLFTLAVGFAVKQPCLAGRWRGQEYTRLCYSDVVALYSVERLDRDLLPYFEARNEYPVLTGFTMALAALPADSSNSFFRWTALLLAACALGVAALLERLVGGRALLFALAPTLAAYAFMNWDLLAVLLATLGTLAYLRGRDAPAGALLGLGAAAKLFPALLVIPFALGRLRDGRRRQAMMLAATALGGWLVVNLPVAIIAPGRWSLFFRFNSGRPPDWDSLWFLAERHGLVTLSTGTVNLLAALTFVVVTALVWRAAWRRDPGFPAWTLGFPIIVAFLLVGKVYSPQFSLWLLPWFALTVPDLRLFAAFSVTEVAVFITRFQFFANLRGVGGLPYDAFEVALLARAVVLALCLVAWIRRQAPAPLRVGTPLEAAA
jgi:uncharacterized membrane protein